MQAATLIPPYKTLHLKKGPAQYSAPKKGLVRDCTNPTPQNSTPKKRASDILLMIACFLLSACIGASPSGELVPGDVERASARWTATAHMMETQHAIATEARRVTEQAVGDSQTATMFPLALQSTQAAATATALPISFTQAAIIDGARIAQNHTQAAYDEFALTATAFPTVAAAQATRQAQIEQWSAVGESVSGFGLGVLRFVVFIFISVVLVALSFALGAWVAFLWRPRFEGNTIIQPTLRGWTVTRPPALPAAKGESDKPNVIDGQQAAPETAWRAWFCDVLAEAESRGSLAYQQLADLFGNDRDKWFDNFAAPLVRLNMVEPIRQGRATKPEPGWTITAIRKVVESGIRLPHPEGEPPALNWPHQRSTVPTAETA